MRNLIDIVADLVTEAATPGQRIETVAKPMTVTLKDGTQAVITIERVTDEDGPQIDVEATVDGRYAGHAKFYPNRVPEWDTDAQGSWSSASTTVNRDYQRKGIATAMYDALAHAGFKITRSGQFGGKLSPDGESLWDSRTEWKKKRGSMLSTPVQARFWKPTKRK